jgi:hypothetical protein
MGLKMQVNVFLLQAGNDSPPTLLVLPDDAPQMVIPKHLRAADWKYCITTISNDALIGGSAWVVDELIQRDGYLLVPWAHC